MGIGIGDFVADFLPEIILLMPVQWKMFVSSAKMRILKPNIDEINAKYPNKEDAMKKQMDMMTLVQGIRSLAAGRLCSNAWFRCQFSWLYSAFFRQHLNCARKDSLWAEDMSSYDSVWDFGTYIPMYGDHLSLFTISDVCYDYIGVHVFEQQQRFNSSNNRECQT